MLPALPCPDGPPGMCDTLSTGGTASVYP